MNAPYYANDDHFPPLTLFLTRLSPLLALSLMRLGRGGEKALERSFSPSLCFGFGEGFLGHDLAG